MGGSLKIVRLFGIPVYLHWTFALIFVYLFALGRWRGWGDAEILEATLLSLALFGCVVLHELGHALMARRYGIQTRDIILSPIGGIARLNRLPDAPMQEVWVALAGPLVNIGIILLLSPVFLLHTSQEWMTYLYSMDPEQSNYLISPVGPLAGFLLTLILLNVMLAVFNLLPAFPMDGGRVLRALLSMKVGRVKATRLATYVGQTMAVFLFIYGLTSESRSYTLAFIGIFVFVMASMEFYMVRMDAVLAKHPVSSLMRTNFSRVYINDTLAQTIRLAQSRLEKTFLVFDEWNNLRGAITQGEIMHGLEQKEGFATVGQFLNPEYTAFLPEDTLQQVLYCIQDTEQKVFPVFDEQRLVGIIDYHMIHQFMTSKREPLRTRRKRFPFSLPRLRSAVQKEHSPLSN